MNIPQKTGWPFATAFLALLALLATGAVSLAQSNATLSSLVSSTGALSPAFTSDNGIYTATAPLASGSMTVTPTASEAGATITVNGSPVASGTPSAPISLNIGNNVITTVVVSADTSATKTYTLTVARNGPITVVNTGTFVYNGVQSAPALTNNQATLANYSTAGVDKLVVTVGGENANPNGIGVINSVTYAGTAMTLAVKRDNATAAYREGAVGIYYLDNPSQNGNVPTGDIVVSYSNFNSFGGSAMSLVGTAPGVGATNFAQTNIASTTSSVSVNTSTEFNIVVAATANGVGNTAQLPTAQAPQTPVLSWRKTPANFWCASGSGYQFVQGLASATSTFTYASTNAATSIAASFGVGVPTLAWDLDGLTPGAGGAAAPSGNWDALTPNWNASFEGTGSAVPWTNGRAAAFAAGTDATGAYTVTVSGTQDISGLSFEEGEVTVQGGTALRLSGFAVVSAAAGLTATVATPLSEDASGRRLVKAGPGSVILSGNNSYTGDTSVTVGGGTLVLAGNNVAATGGMTLNGGVTRFESPASINGTARNVTINSGGAVTFSATFGEGNIPAALANRIVATSAGAIAADNYVSTAFNFNTPGLTAASLGAVGAVEYTGTLTPNGTTYRLGGGGGTLTMINPNAVTGAGNSLVINGNVTLSDANNFVGSTTLNTGNLGIGADTSLGSGPLTVNSGSISSNSTNERTLANPVTLAGTVDLGDTVNTGKLSFTGSMELGAANRIFNLGSDVEFAGPVTGTGFGFTKNGAGILTLSGPNTYTGATTVNSGTLVLNGSNNSTGATTITNGGIQLGGSVNGGLASGTLTFGALIPTFIQPIDGDRTISNNVVLTYNASAGGVGTISGSNNLTINGTFTHSRPGGGNGTLTSSLDPGKVLTLAGQVRLSESNTAARTLTIDGTGETVITGQVVNGGPTGTGTGAGGLTKNGSGTLTLKGINTYTGATTVNIGGCLALVGGSQTSAITVSNGAFLGLTPGSPTTSTAALNLGATSKIRIIGNPIPGSTLLITAASINGTPVLETPIDNYSLVADATTIRLVGGSDFDVWTSSFLPTVIGGPTDDFDGDGLNNDQERIFGLNPTSGTSSNPISVPLNPSAGTFSYTRRDPALTGKVFKVWTSTTLANWTVDEGALLTPGPLVNQVQTVAVVLSGALLSEPKLFVRVGVQDFVPPPPLLSTNFEDDDGGFTVATSGGTPWAYGVVNSLNQGGGAITAGNSGTKCWGTNLTGGYAASTDTSLRSPVIDLTGVTGATLSFARAIDANAGHTLEVNILNAAGTFIANVIPPQGDTDINAAPWQNVGPIAIPALALGQPVRIEWRFIGNGDGLYNGAYIDDVLVTPTP
jgi:autotransporter-associated beta strand protein